MSIVLNKFMDQPFRQSLFLKGLELSPKDNNLTTRLNNFEPLSQRIYYYTRSEDIPNIINHLQVGDQIRNINYEGYRLLIDQIWSKYPHFDFLFEGDRLHIWRLT